MLTTVNVQCENEYPQKIERAFTDGLENARNLLYNLKRSVDRSHKYEIKLIQCKASHAITNIDSCKEHPVQSAKICEIRLEANGNKTVSRTPVKIRALPAANVVCLQYKYEELSQRYESLLSDYEKQTSVLRQRDAQLDLLRDETQKARAELLQAHNNLLAVGEKYLVLNKRRKLQKLLFEAKLHHLCRMLHGVLRVAEHTRCAVETKYFRKLASERDSLQAALVSEIQKCQRLSIENSRLRSTLEPPGSIHK